MLRPWIVVSALSLAIATEGQGAECFGPASGTQVIFLHGIYTGDTQTPIDYHNEWKNLAAKKAIRVAFPRSTQLCKGSTNRYCWGTETPESVAKTYQQILDSVKACIDPTRDFGLVGFSNGGYHATRVALLCLSPQPQFILAVGSSGDPNLARSNDLSLCSPVDLLIGNRDITKESARNFVEKVAVKKLRTSFATFPGAHQLPMGAVEKYLLKKLPNPSIQKQ